MKEDVPDSFKKWMAVFDQESAPGHGDDGRRDGNNDLFDKASGQHGQRAINMNQFKDMIEDFSHVLSI